MLGQAELAIRGRAVPLLTPAPVTARGVDAALGAGAPSCTAFVHVCLAGVTLPSCRAVTAARLDTAPSVLARWLAYCCSTGPGESAGPLPAGAASVARPDKGRPGAAAVGGPVDGPVGAAGSVPITGGEEGLVHPLHKRLRLGAPGSPDGAHPAARPEDVLGATHCQHQEPQQKQLPGVTHGPRCPESRPSPDGGLEHRAQPPKSLCRPRLGPMPPGATAPQLCDTRPAQPLCQQESPDGSASSDRPQPVSAGEAGPLPATGAQDRKPAPLTGARGMLVRVNPGVQLARRGPRGASRPVLTPWLDLVPSLSRQGGPNLSLQTGCKWAELEPSPAGLALWPSVSSSAKRGVSHGEALEQ